MAAPAWLDPGADTAPSAVPPRRPVPAVPRRSRVVPALLAGVLAAGLALAGRLTGLLDGPAGLAAAVVLLLLVPTSRELARRVLFAGCLVLGWVPALWWTPLPVGAVGRVTIGLALLAAVVGAFAVTRPRAMLPRVRVVDVMLPVTALLGVWTLWPWLMVKTAAQTMGLLLSGWDNVAHFSMVHSARLHGVTVDAMGGAWQFANYPEGFHAVVAGTQELLTGPVPGDLATELEAYPRGVAVIVIAATLTAVAGLCALPALRRRPVLAIPATALAATVFLLGPGATAVENGFGNFVVACTLVCAATLVAVSMPRLVAPLPLAALGGAVVGIATGWALLLVLVAPALVAVLLPLRASRYRATAGRAATAIVLVVVVSGCLARTAFVLSRVQSDALLTPGGVAPPGLGDVALVALALVVACVATRRARIIAIATVPVLGIALAVVMALAQIDVNGVVSYYALKFATALGMVLPVLLLIPLAHLLTRRAPRGVGAGAAGVVLAVAATQVFGLAIPDATDVGLPPQAPGAADRARHLRTLDIPPSTADLVDRVAAAPAPTRRAYYLDVPTDGVVHPALAAQWYLALTDTWTGQANRLGGGVTLGRRPFDDDSVVSAAQRILVGDPEAVILVRPDYVATLAKGLDDPTQRARIFPL